MKICPFCDWENEDTESKCLACGSELPTAEVKTENTTESAQANTETQSANAGENTFGVKITNVGANKIAVIKVVKETTGFGLADAKKAVETGFGGAGLSRERAEDLLSKLRAVGAEGEILENCIEQTTTGIGGQSATQNPIGDKKNLIIGVLIGVVVTMIIVFLLAR